MAIARSTSPCHGADPSCVDGGDGAKGADGSSLIVGRERREELLEQSVALTSVTLTRRQLADLELLLNGGFAPLTGFMTRDEYITVCCEMRLPNDVLWPMPVTLRVPETLATRLANEAAKLKRSNEISACRAGAR